jgi:hypothetical protein
MLDQIGLFFSAVGGILSLDPAVISSLQAAPNGLALAVWILILGTLSDVLGDSPLLFFNQMQPSRFALAFGIEILLSLVRLIVWLLGFWLFVLVLSGTSVSLATVVLVVGLGYAPMLLGILVVIPTFGPPIGRLLQAWTLVTILASIAVALHASPWQVLAPAIFAIAIILILRRVSDRFTTAVLGGVSRRLLGFDVMQRTRAMDPLLTIAGRQPSASPGTG